MPFIEEGCSKLLKKMIRDRTKIYSEANYKINCEDLTKNMIVNEIINLYEKN